jgi:hypothetical protein
VQDEAVRRERSNSDPNADVAYNGFDTLRQDSATNTARNAAGVAADVYRLNAAANFEGAGEANALARAWDLATRASLGLKTASQQEKILAAAARMSRLARIASAATLVGNVVAGVNAVVDTYQCLTR